MKRITQQEFDVLPIVNKIRQCPGYTDYSLLSNFGEGCRFGERCSFGERCIVISPYWSFVYPPPFTVEGRIYPPDSCRGYWEQLLNIKLSGCYNEINNQITPDIINAALSKNNLSECDRVILESWKD